MNEDHLISRGVAVEFLLSLARPTAFHHDVVIQKHGDTPRDGIAGDRQTRAFDVMMTKHGLVGRLPGQFSGRLNLLHARGWPQMIANAIRFAKAADGDDFFVVDPLVAIAGFVFVGNMAFTWYRTH